MTPLRRWIRGVPLGFVLSVAFLTVGCVDIEGPTPPSIPASDVFSEFQFTTAAMMIKPGQTLQTALVATSTDDSPIPVDISKVRWQSADSSRVFIDSLGHVVAKAASNNAVEINALYTHGTTTRRASLMVYVTEDEELSATSLKMVALDSTRIGGSVEGLTPLPRVRLDLYQGSTRVRTGVKFPIVAPSPYVVTYVENGGPNLEPVYTIGISSIKLGKFWVTSSVNLYGSEVHDSVEFTGTYPSGNVAGIAFDADDQGNIVAKISTRVVMEPCGVLWVTNFSPHPLEIVFSDSLVSTDGCTPTVLPDVFQGPFAFLISLGLVSWNDKIGGNMQLAPRSLNIRRTPTRGVITWYVRDPVTKERLPYSGQYSSLHEE